MRAFSAAYLEASREGMWADSREALSGLQLADRDRILDIGCGTGELSAVMQSESTARVVGVDADPSLLQVAADTVEPVAGDAGRLPFAEDSFDLVVCQALLVNLPDPKAAIEEFVRVASETVAAIEPDNSAVTVDSSVAAESQLEARARAAYIAGVPTDATLGGDSTHRVFEEVGLNSVRTTRHDHVRTVEPPYSERAIEDAKRKANGAGLRANRQTMLAGTETPESLDDLRNDWRSMGRSVIEQMQSNAYRRREVVPFFVTVGAVSG